jgi:hypothetical protein
MNKTLPFAALAMLCMSQPLLAQQGYDFLKRDNPYGLSAQQGAGDMAFCWSSVGNRVAYVTNIFPPRSDTNEQLVSMLQRAKPGWTFTCVFGQSPQINTTAVQKTSELAGQASVEQLTIGPTGGR